MTMESIINTMAEISVVALPVAATIIGAVLFGKADSKWQEYLKRINSKPRTL